MKRFTKYGLLMVMIGLTACSEFGTKEFSSPDDLFTVPDSGSMILYPQLVQCHPGDTIDLRLSVEGVLTLSGFQCALILPPFVELLRIEPGLFFSRYETDGASIFISEAKDDLTLIYSSFLAEGERHSVDGSGELAIVWLRALRTGAGEVSIEGEQSILADADGAEIEISGIYSSEIEVME
ncbi:MAG TPA: hypothetical protein ENN84_05630 [Candidatus Marinimicrobia bacterium]|nr:hypothetical protein [Candidatus Neomarinimicrobiota bacterium]